MILTALGCCLSAAGADFDIGSGSYIWDNIGNTPGRNSYSINGGTISFNKSVRVTGKSFEIGENGATFDMTLYVTFDYANFTQSNAAKSGGINFHMGAGAEHYFENSTFDAGTLTFTGGNALIAFNKTKVVLSQGEMIDNRVTTSTFYLQSGTISLDLLSYAADFSENGTNEWTIIHSENAMSWSNMMVGTLAESFTKQSDYLYTYSDSYGDWTFTAGSNGATLTLSIPEPSTCALIGIAIGFAGMGRRKS